MKIAYISGSYLPSRQANGIHVMRMTAAMARLGHDVTLYARHAPEGDQVTNLAEFYGCAELVQVTRVASIRWVRGREAWYALQARRLIAREAPDLIYGRHLPGLLCCAGIAPTIYETHAMRPGVNACLESLLLRRRNVRAIVAISRSLAHDFRERHDPDVPLLIEPDAVDPIDYDNIEPAPLRGSSRLRVGYCGHLYPGRGGELLLEVAKRRPEYEVHIVGGEPNDIARLRALGQDLANVFPHGFVPPRDVPRYLAAMDVLVAPYQERVEAYGKSDIARWISPMKLFEYMDSGKPVVISNLPTIREVVSHDETALLVPPGDIDAWCAAIDRLADSHVRQRLGEAARRLVRQRFTWDARAQRVLELATRVAGTAVGSWVA